MDLLSYLQLLTSKCASFKIDEGTKEHIFFKEFTMGPRICNPAVFYFQEQVQESLLSTFKKKEEKEEKEEEEERKNVIYVRNLYICAMMANLILSNSL